MSKNSGLFFLNRSIKHYKINCMNMKFNSFTINIVSFLITMVIILFFLIPKYFIYNSNNNNNINNVDNLINRESKSNTERDITDWRIKIPEIMLNKSIVEGKLDYLDNQNNQTKNSMIHYDKSYIENGSIVLLCKEKIDNIKKDVSVYYKVNSTIYEYRTLEKEFIKKEELDKLLRRRK